MQLFSKQTSIKTQPTKLKTLFLTLYSLVFIYFFVISSTLQLEKNTTQIHSQNFIFPNNHMISMCNLELK